MFPLRQPRTKRFRVDVEGNRAFEDTVQSIEALSGADSRSEAMRMAAKAFLMILKTQLEGGQVLLEDMEGNRSRLIVL